MASSLVASLWAMGAHAQQAQPETRSVENSVSEIIVTARKKEERAQDVPLSLTVASGAELADRSIRNVGELAQLAPALTLTPSPLSPTSLQLSSRGVVVPNTRLTIDPGIGVYIDGVNIPRTYGILASELYDVDRIEVLQGPQGTLYGKNNTGGAINYYTTLPIDEYAAQMRLRVATGRELNGAGFVNLPVADNFKLRMVGLATNRRGFGKDLVSGADFGRLETGYMRATGVWEATDKLKVTLRGDYIDVYTTTNPGKGGSILTGSARLEVATALGYTAADLNNPTIAAIVNNAYVGLQNGDPQDGVGNVLSQEDLTHWGVSGQIDYALTDNVGFKSITAWRRVKSNAASDFDGSPFQLAEFPTNVVRADNFSQEVQLTGNSLEDRLSWILGGYYAHESGYQFLMSRNLGILTRVNGPAQQHADVVNKTWAVFGQGTYEILPTLKLTAGLRYTEDSRNVVLYNRNNVACTALGVSLASLGAAPCVYSPPTADFDAISYTIGLDWHPSDDLMFYARHDRSYRTGGIALEGGNAASPAAARGTFEAFKPEYAKNYEIGVKSVFFDRRLTFNAAAYIVRYEDLQRSLTRAVPGTNPAVVYGTTFNAATAEVKGVELMVAVRPVSRLTLSGTLALSDPKYIEFIDPVTGLSRVNNGFQMLVEKAYTLSASYSVPMAFGDVDLRADYSWQDSTITALPATSRDSLGTLNLRAKARIAQADLDISLFVKNATDEQIGWMPIDLVTPGLGIITAGPTNEPRQWGVEITKNF